MFLKKGRSSAGVARQYSGTAGRIENCQIGVFLTYATEAGRTFLDRELYLPKEWTADVDRCAAAGIPVERKFATKHWWPLTRSHAHSMPAKWATGDAVYGHHAGLRRALEKRGLHYVLAVPVNQRVIARAGPIGTEFRADELTASLSGRSWRTRSGAGRQGRPPLRLGTRPDQRRQRPGGRALAAGTPLPGRPTEIASYICHAPARVSLAELVRVAGARWAIEETFQTAKGETGPDHYQVRQFTGWYRHITLSMFAHAFLTVVRSKKGALNPATAS